MADIIKGQNEPASKDINEKYKDMGDGTYAKVVYAAGSAGEGGTAVEITNDEGNPIPVASGPGGVQNAVVAAAGNLSAAVDLGSQRLGFVGTPADVGASTQLGFQISGDGVTFRDLYDQYGTRYKVPVDASRAIGVDLTLFAAARHVKVQFLDAAGAASNYANQRTVTLGTLA